MKITKPNKGTKITTFDSLQELVNHIRTGTVAEVFKIKPVQASEKEVSHNDTWYQTRNLDEALELLKSGWTDKSKELEQKFADKVKKEATTVTRQKSVYDVVGGNCSVPRYLQGVPTAMVRQVRQPVKQKVLTVNYNISFPFSTSGDTIIEKAVDCLSYVKKLEDTGTRVNLNVYLVTKEPYSGNLIFGYVVPVKKSSERFSVSKMAFTLCHPSMLRRIMFACIERDADMTEDFVYGHGSPVKDTKELSKIFPDVEFFS